MFKSIDEMEEFNGRMDQELLLNGFIFHDDWEYGLIDSWTGQEDYVLKLMRHNFGYWLIFGYNTSGEI